MIADILADPASHQEAPSVKRPEPICAESLTMNDRRTCRILHGIQSSRWNACRLPPGVSRISWVRADASRPCRQIFRACPNWHSGHGRRQRAQSGSRSKGHSNICRKFVSGGGALNDTLIHALAQFDQHLVGVAYLDKSKARILEIDDHIGSHRQGDGEADGVQSV